MILSRSARSDQETGLAARSPGGADAHSSFFLSVGAPEKFLRGETVVPFPRCSTIELGVRCHDFCPARLATFPLRKRGCAALLFREI